MFARGIPALCHEAEDDGQNLSKQSCPLIAAFPARNECIPYWLPRILECLRTNYVSTKQNTKMSAKPDGGRVTLLFVMFVGLLEMFPTNCGHVPYASFLHGQSVRTLFAVPRGHFCQRNILLFAALSLVPAIFLFLARLPLCGKDSIITWSCTVHRLTFSLF